MKYVLMVSSSRPFFAGVLLLLLLNVGSTTRVSAATPEKSSNNLIRIWTVGSPHPGAFPPAVVPADLQQRAESLGYTIEIQAFLANGFAAIFREALQSHNEPEILTFDNYGVITGIQTSLGSFEGVDSDYRVASSLALV